ncbi:MAG: hypothetical protein WBG90_07785 [Saonia sp.]
MKYFIIGILMFFQANCQENNQKDWTSDEKRRYENLKKLAQYTYQKDDSQISEQILFEKYIELDYVLNDSNKKRSQSRLKYFDGYFRSFRKTLDSIGIENLDAKPMRFYKENELFKYFIKSQKDNLPYVMAYYLKSDPENPLGTLLFDPNSDKLLSWIFLRQGETSGFYLTFDLVGN